MGYKFLEDANGNKSSKRLAGICLLAQGSLMKLVLFLYSLNHVTAISFERLDSCIDTMIYTGVALIGSGLIELLKQGKK